MNSSAAHPPASRTWRRFRWQDDEKARRAASGRPSKRIAEATDKPLVRGATDDPTSTKPRNASDVEIPDARKDSSSPGLPVPPGSPHEMPPRLPLPARLVVIGSPRVSANSRNSRDG